MKNTLETRLGVFFALVMIATIIMIEMIGGFEFFKTGLTGQASFNNVQELKVGDSVKMAGVQIGRVEKIKFSQGKVVVTMKITDPDAEIKTDSKATIKFTGLMGQNYVSIDLGSATAAKATTPFSLITYEQADLGALMGRLDAVASSVEGMTKSFSADNLGNFLGPFTDFLKENRERLSGIVSNVHTVTGDIAQGKGTVGKLIHEDALYNTALSTVTNINATFTDAKGVVDQAKTLVANANQGEGTVGKLLKDPKLYDDTTAAMTNLRQIMEKVNQGQGSVGKLVNDEALIKNVKMTLQKLDKATDGLEDQGPLSVIGILGGKLF
jgi:phospholipid/cholesterol/gamma-HCH transport system substrate-binding protein